MAMRSSLVLRLRRQIASISEHLGHDELAVLILVAGRLRGGRSIYGELRLAAVRLRLYSVGR